jgi:hypothetical protein
VTSILFFAAATVSSVLTVAAPAPPRPVLVASPARVVLDGVTRAVVHVAAPRGHELVDVSLAPYALDLRGRPRLGGGARPPRWVSARPAHLSVGPDGALVTLAASPPRGALPGDRPFALVLTTRGVRGTSVAVRLRIGVLVIAHVPGKAVRRLVIGPLRVRRSHGVRILELTIRNSGNVVERLTPGQLVFALYRRGRIVARLHPPARELLPHSRAIVTSALRPPLRGPANVRVTLGAFVHSYPLRL